MDVCRDDPTTLMGCRKCEIVKERMELAMNVQWMNGYNDHRCWTKEEQPRHNGGNDWWKLFTFEVLGISADIIERRPGSIHQGNNYQYRRGTCVLVLPCKSSDYYTGRRCTQIEERRWVDDPVRHLLQTRCIGQLQTKSIGTIPMK
jgi:hypothetical protein